MIQSSTESNIYNFLIEEDGLFDVQSKHFFSVNKNEYIKFVLCQELSF